MEKSSKGTRQSKEMGRNLQPGEYSLDWDVIGRVPIEEYEGEAEGGASRIGSTTVREVCERFNGHASRDGDEDDDKDHKVNGESILKIDFPGDDGLSVQTASGVKRFSGSRFAEQLLFCS